MLKIGDKIKCIKRTGFINTKGMTFEVKDISGGNIAVVNEYGFGFIHTTDIKEISEYFIKVKQWTPWIKTGQIEYKTDNEKYVLVKWENYTAKSSCNLKCDKFDLDMGIFIALQKLENKIRNQTNP